MATAFEGGCEELVHDLARHVVVDEPTRHHEHIRIVVLTDQMGNLRNPAQTGTHLLVLVQRDADTLAATADGDTGIYLTALDTLGQSMTEVGIVNRCIAPSTVVLIGVALLFQVLEHELFQRVACVIASYTYCLYFHSSCFLGTDSTALSETRLKNKAVLIRVIRAN